ncbi:MAG: HAD family hydrolase [Bacillota bacterium]|nr:HAD family hydrolase [Bacillota bacterium]
MKLEAVIFDLDGTIADTIKLTLHAIRETARKFTGREMSDEDALSMFGPVDTEIIKTLVKTHEQQAAIEDYLNTFSDSFEDYVKPIEGIPELLTFIKQSGVKTGLFTGRGRIATDIILSKLGLKKYFDEIISGDDTKAFKPDPDGILKMLKKLDVKAVDSVYAGDFDVDIKASRNAGTKAVLALWSSTADEGLMEHKPDAAFKTPYDYMEWLKDKL